MYSKPEVRIIQDQQVESKPQDVTSSEAADLLAKYGYSTQNYNPQPTTTNNPNNDITAQQLYDQWDREMELQRQKELQRRNGPKAYTFDNNNVNYSSTDYKSLDDGFGIQVQIVSDMSIYNNNNRR